MLCRSKAGSCTILLPGLRVMYGFAYREDDQRLETQQRWMRVRHECTNTPTGPTRTSGGHAHVGREGVRGPIQKMPTVIPECAPVDAGVN